MWNMNRTRCVLYCILWRLSILLGFSLLFAPLLPLLLLNRPLYRRITDILMSLWEAFSVSVLDIVLGVRVRLSGDCINARESSLVVVNYRTSVDHNFLASALFHSSNPVSAANAKVVLSEELRHLPGIGWAAQMSRFVYIARDWKRDETKLCRLINHLSSVTEQPFQVLLFPEGAEFNDRNKLKSDSFADANNVKRYTNVLHPRTTGFAFIVEKMRENRRLDAVYDVTIAYPDRMPANEQALLDGILPDEVHFHVKRHSAQSVPTTIVGLEKWLQELWRDKELLLESFYRAGNSNGDTPSFPALSFVHQSKSRQQTILPIQYLCLLSWIYFMYWALVNVVLSLWGIFWLFFVSLFMFTLSKRTGGLQEVEAKLEKNGSFKGLWALVWGIKQD